jgi:ubiquinone/menaquinone biosynthesis C-methylase UbiE
LGVDISDDALLNAKTYDKTVPVLLGDISKLPFVDESFDAIMCLGVVEHDEEGPQTFLKEIYRVMKPQGLLFLTVPYESVFRRFVHFPLANVLFFIQRIYYHRKLKFGEYRYSKRDIVQFVNEVNFNIMKVDIDEYIVKDRSMALSVDWLSLFNDKGKTKFFKLNSLGIIVNHIFSLFSPWFNSGGIFLLCKKKEINW